MNRFVHGLKMFGMYCVGVPALIIVGLILCVFALLNRGGEQGIDLS